MDLLKKIFLDINNNKWDNVLKIIKEKNKEIDFNIPYNNIYLLEILIINNKKEIIVELLNNENIFLNIFDLDNNPIIFIAIKYNLYDILKILLEYNYIGISLLDLQNNNGINCLLYSIKLNNKKIIKFLLDKTINYTITDNNNNGILHYFSKYSTLDNIMLLNLNKININKQNKFGETALHISINYNKYDISKYLINSNIDLDIKDYKFELSAIHYLIVNNNLELLNNLNKINFTIQDYKGRNYIHYLIIYNKQKKLLEILNTFKDDINYNMSDISGSTPLHLILQSNYFSESEKIIRILITKTKLNLQDNKGNTCLYYLLKNNIWKSYIDILKIKKLNIFIYNLKNEQIIDLIDTAMFDEFFNIIIISFYNYLIKNKDSEFEDYLDFCKSSNSHKDFKNKYSDIYNNILNKFKNVDKSNICKDIIKFYIIEKKLSIPEKKNKICIKIDKPLKLDFVPYTGSNLDILCGLFYLEYNHNNVQTTLTKNFINNNKLFNYYNNSGKYYFNKNGIDFYNIEIIWDKQKLIFPEGIEKLFLNLNKRFFIIPIGIENDFGYHSNILIYDTKNNLIERFEPNGKSGPSGYYYNSSKLDDILKFKLKKYIKKDFKYLYPKIYLPKIGLQIYENLEEKKKNIGDPGGYCSSWSLWYADMVLKYPDIDRKKLILKIIYTIKKNQISFKDNIRFFTNHIIKIRKKILENTGITINDWINNNYDKDKYNKLINNIINKFNL